MEDLIEAGALRRKKAQRRLVIIAVALAIAGVGYWYVDRTQFPSLQSVLSLENSAERFVLDKIKANVPSVVPSTPPPLKAPATPAGKSPSQFTLTRAGVIAETNLARTANGGLPSFTEDASLDTIAALRLGDMFAKQYFAHVAPDGGSVQTVASSVGYEYLAIGENLALGNFLGDEGVVTAWMNSPGHRTNILSTHYTQIGVAVRKGVFEGEDTWIAVQIFGRPASDCPAPDASLKTAIGALESQLSQMEADIQAKRAEIDAMEPKRGPAYNQKVDAYNAEVSRYNALVAETKAKVAEYNTEVAAFNQCIAS